MKGDRYAHHIWGGGGNPLLDTLLKTKTPGMKSYELRCKVFYNTPLQINYWPQARNLVTLQVIQRRLKSYTRYGTLNKLTIDWANITEAWRYCSLNGTPVDEQRLKRLGISITEPWRDIVSGKTQQVY